MCKFTHFEILFFKNVLNYTLTSSQCILAKFIFVFFSNKYKDNWCHGEKLSWNLKFKFDQLNTSTMRAIKYSTHKRTPDKLFLSSIGFFLVKKLLSKNHKKIFVYLMANSMCHHQQNTSFPATNFLATHHFLPLIIFNNAVINQFLPKLTIAHLGF